eukprot:CAMPEP_0185909502 /NCGR_PEP_ID=MMETSP0196C-20130402/13206_1 /TAXON_ID=2932 /ORGANISM="Alexandrium fundyense, Strain CCMP1719" /LENGTH=82 /DNA_ID=CAMNT_0028630017 /DNA_START=77 /DNA_END=325 /DNA_ORIENTATION=-
MSAAQLSKRPARCINLAFTTLWNAASDTSRSGSETTSVVKPKSMTSSITQVGAASRFGAGTETLLCSARSWLTMGGAEADVA